MTGRFALHRLVRVLLLLAVMLLVSGLLGGCGTGTKEVRFVAPDGSERGRFRLEVADTEPLHQKGLMFRDSLPVKGGMLFIFPKPAPLTFWMKNTKLSLDMLFISKDHTVQGILGSVPPMNEEPRAVSGIESQYVIELGAGVAAANGIQVGDSVRW